MDDSRLAVAEMMVSTYVVAVAFGVFLQSGEINMHA